MISYMASLPVVGRIGKFSGRMLFDRAGRRLRQINNLRPGAQPQTMRCNDGRVVDLGHVAPPHLVEIPNRCSLHRNAPVA
jgi:hypothetical protein